MTYLISKTQLKQMIESEDNLGKKEILQNHLRQLDGEACVQCYPETPTLTVTINPDKEEYCVECGSVGLDTGWECTDCGHDNIDIYQKRE